MMASAREVLLSVNWLNIGLVALTGIIGFLIAQTVSKLVGRQVEKKWDSTTGMISQKIVFYGLLVFAFAVVLHEMDVSLGALLATGGLFGVALGFASQTAVSNIISGVFLIFERPFDVGDVIKVGDKFGGVQSIDLLSTKIRTFDNLYWRMPNEQLLKSDIITITKYDIRRMDIVTSISYEDDIQVGRETLLEVAEDNPLVMADPEPIVLVGKMGDSGIELTLRCWFYKTDYIQLLSELTEQAKVALEEAGCTIPFPHRTLYVRNEEIWQTADALGQEIPGKSDTSE
ncbi:MAG: mechanosensitive ion channel family protein [bacterium]